MHSSRERHDSTRHGFDAPKASHAALHAGEVLAERYRLEREVGRTEAGVVFDGIDLNLNRHVAVEIASSIEEPKARRKWARDAMLAQRLEGEHVLRVLDVGNLVGGVPYAVREAALCTMAAEIEVKGALPVPLAVAWTLEACEAVAEAHALGMAHGDLRLDNVYLVRPRRNRGDGESGEPTVKVAFTSAAKAERAAKEDVARDLAGLGAMLRVLSTGRLTDDEADGAPTLPTDLAHAVARSLSLDPCDRIQNVAELARMLAPYAPPGHTSARNIAFLMSRAGIVAGALPLAVTAPPSSRRPRQQSGVVPAAPIVVKAPSSTRDGAAADRASFTDEWFGRAQRTPLRASLAPARRPARPVFAMVSLALIALVLGGSWFLWQNGMLPRWTGAAPPEAVGNTQVTSGAAASPDESTTAEPAVVAAPAAAAAAASPASPPANATAEPATTSVDALPSAPATNAGAATRADAPSTTKRARGNDTGTSATDPSTSTGGAGLRYVDPSSTTTTTVPSPNAPPAAGPTSTASPSPGTTSGPATTSPAASPATSDTSGAAPSGSPSSTSPASDSTSAPSSGSGSSAPSPSATSPESTPTSPSPSPGY